MDLNRLSDTTEYSSLSNYNDFTIEHIHLDWDIDFDASKINGSVSLDVVSSIKELTNIILDTRDLSIQSVEVDGKKAAHSLQDAGVFGSSLSFPLPSALALGAKAKVKITYSTSPDSTALQWLEPAQTAGKVKPYLFSQCQAIHARSMVPCVDAPGHKSTYSASVTAPSWATVLMSALEKDKPKAMKDNDTRVFTWHQPVACSSYLIAIAVGELESKEVSKRCRVWSEPSMVKEVEYEFSQTEDFLVVAEKLAGPYRWGRYDLLCLPPSFPYGGMENPCLTFVTPTLLAGDKSLADVVAHEIAHSWTGNLVTNSSWTHFWLNEGWTRWFETSIMTEIQGDDRYFDLRASLGYEALKSDVSRYMSQNESHLTALVPPLKGIDPDDSFSSVPYERGMNLLLHIQQRVGKNEFQAFFKHYVAVHASKTVNSQGFKDFTINYFKEKGQYDEIKDVMWNEWFLQEGMPPVEPKYDLSLLDPVNALAKDVCAGVNLNTPKEDFNEWPSLQQQLFLQALLDHVGTTGQLLPSSTLDILDAKYQLTSKTNSELRFKWTKLCLICGRESILKFAASFAVSQGRMKFVRPLYRALMECDIPGAAELAIGTFAANKLMYHPICRKMVASDMDRAWTARKNAEKKKELAAAASSNDSSSKSADNASSSGQDAPVGGMSSFIAGVGFGAVFMTVLGIVLAKQKN
jgi:leukotriene-A4 hydrolase